MTWNKHAKRRTRIPRNQVSTAKRINTNFVTRTTNPPQLQPPATGRSRSARAIKQQSLDSKALKVDIPNELPTTATKCCAIVGNAASIFQIQQGEYIDKFDLVVRINTVRIRESACQGKKTTLLFAHGGVIDTIPRRVYKAVEVINTNTDLASIHAVWSERIKQEICDTARLSTGFMAIVAMMELDYHITLFGFDWYATPTYYTNRGPWKKHHPDWEKNIIIPLLEEHNARVCNLPAEPQVLQPSS
jgi:hypothetical protein